jgi:alkylation response protein AidB-like acyl-CoA dehydrogenase
VASDLAALDAWIDEQWDPSITAGEWWARLAAAGWAAPTLPTARGGRGATSAEADAIAARLAERGVLGPPGGAAMSIVAPTLADHADPEQVETLLRPILAGRTAWCLLFSEPGAGTDLAALETTATPDGEGWRLDGRKTWATGAHLADMAIVLARTGPAGGRHRGLTCFALDMRGDGIEVRPMREMTGRALSNDVLLDGAWVDAAHVIGDVGDGWAVVNVALGSERRTVGRHRSSPAVAGVRSGDLDRPAGELLSRPRRARATPVPPPVLARRVAAAGSPSATARQDLARLHSAVSVAEWTAVRAGALDAAGRPLEGAANIAKLWAGEIARRSAAVALATLGARGTLHAYDGTLADDDEAAGEATAMALAAPAVSLVGGVDLVQRDLIGERVLGLPRSPAP